MPLDLEKAMPTAAVGIELRGDLHYTNFKPNVYTNLGNEGKWKDKLLGLP